MSLSSDNKKIPTQILNVIYFFDNEKMRKIRLPFFVVKLIFIFFVIFCFYVCVTSYLAFESLAKVKKIKKENSALLEAVLDYQVKYDKVFSNVYSSYDSSTTRNEQITKNKVSPRIIKYIDNLSDIVSRTDSDNSTVSIEKISVLKKKGYIEVVFGLVNSGPTKKLIGSLLGVAYFTSPKGGDYVIGAPKGAAYEKDSGEVKLIYDKAKVFEVKRIVRKKLRFYMPKDASVTLSRVEIWIVNKDGIREKYDLVSKSRIGFYEKQKGRVLDL